MLLMISSASRLLALASYAVYFVIQYSYASFTENKYLRKRTTISEPGSRTADMELT